VGHFFDDPLHEFFAATLAFGLTSKGGVEPGEISATCSRIADGDDGSWYDEWCATADRIAAAGRASAAAGHRVSARDALIRASIVYGLAYHPLFGSPIDARLVSAAARERDAFAEGVALLDLPGEPFTVDLDGASMPAWFFAAQDGPAPVVIATNGYDAGTPDLFLGIAVPALRRGYHCVVFDGPGQGRMLVEQQVPIRADWERVVTPVVDAVLARPDVDSERVALMGWSLGGYLALRAASAEPRLAACIADPALYGIREGMLERLRQFGVPDDVIAAYPDIPTEALAPMAGAFENDRFLHWTLVQRGFWVHGVDSFAAYVRATADFSLAGRLEHVRCPTLVTMAEADPLAASAAQVVAELGTATADLVRFSAVEGAGDHCEWVNRSRFDQVAFDWLDEQLAAR